MYKRQELRIESTRDKYIFSYSIDGENFIVIGEGLAAGLSTEITEVMTFTGTYLGIFAQGGVAKPAANPSPIDVYKRQQMHLGL